MFGILFVLKNYKKNQFLENESAEKMNGIKSIIRLSTQNANKFGQKDQKARERKKCIHVQKMEKFQESNFSSLE